MKRSKEMFQEIREEEIENMNIEELVNSAQAIAETWQGIGEGIKSICEEYKNNQDGKEITTQKVI